MTALPLDLREAVEMMDWYRRCLEDVLARKPVRGLAEAHAGYDVGKALIEQRLMEYEPVVEAARIVSAALDRGFTTEGKEQEMRLRLRDLAASLAALSAKEKP